MKATFSCYLIKPSAMDHTREIRSLIEQFGLEIVRHQDFIITRDQIRVMYKDASPSLFKAIECEMEGESCEVGIVANYRNERTAMEKLMDAVGRDKRPSHCLPSSARFHFGTHDPKLVGLTTYWENGMHCTRSEEELQAFLNAFGLTLPDPNTPVGLAGELPDPDPC